MKQRVQRPFSVPARFRALSLLLATSHAIAQPLLSREQAIEDVKFYHQTLREVHYNPFLFIDSAKYEAGVSLIVQQIPDSIILTDFILLFYQITSLIEDSHTSPAVSQPALKEELRMKDFFPYKLIVQNDSLYVPRSTALVSGLPAGASIIAINGKNVPLMIRQFSRCYGGNDAYRREMANRLLPYFLFLAGIKPPFQLTWQDSLGNRNQKEISSGVSFANALSVTMPSIKKKYSFELIDGRLGLFNFLSMGGSIDAFDRFADSCISVMKKNKAGILAIDLRQNSGGNSQFADLLISYFSKKKYSLMGMRRWKVSEQYQSHLLQYGDTSSQYLQKPVGTIWELGNCRPYRNPYRNDNLFKGRVFLITGPFTFSSAVMFADGVKQYGLASVIGEPTGENTNNFGELYTFMLPNSKMNIQVTTSFDTGADCDASRHSPVMPDILLTDKLQDKIEEKDLVLEYLLQLAKNPKQRL